MLILKLSRFSLNYTARGKRAAILKQTYFSQKQVRLYIVLALSGEWILNEFTCAVGSFATGNFAKQSYFDIHKLKMFVLNKL